MTDQQRSHEYEDGVRDGRLASLERTVNEIAADFRKVKVMIYMLYGAIALVQFLPELRGFIGATP